MTRYGRLTVLEVKREPVKETGRKTRPTAVCKCDCGNIVTRKLKTLRAGKSNSCGCIKGRVKCDDPVLRKRQQILVYAKARAKKKSLPFDLTIEDIVIPTHCPLLDIPLVLDNVIFADDSPSLDRLIPHLGYIKSNIQVISVRANTIKNNASLDELMLLTERLHAIFMEGVE